MELWLFFTIFGCVLFIPSALLFLLLNRFKNTIVVLIKQNGALLKIVITNKILERGQITEAFGKKIKPINITKDEIYYGKWRRWIIKPELHSKTVSQVTDKEVEEYLNNEDLLKLYLAGKFKDMLMLLMGITIAAVIIGAIINGYLTKGIECMDYGNQSRDFIFYTVKSALYNVTGV